MFTNLSNYQSTLKFANYEKSINEMFNLYCEIQDFEINNINVFEKAKLLDTFYKEHENKEPQRHNDVRCFIIREYKKKNPDYGKLKGENKNAFKQDDVAKELAKEGCELLSKYKNCYTPIYYKYQDNTYWVKFKRWKHAHYRPHLV